MRPLLALLLVACDPTGSSKGDSAATTTDDTSTDAAEDCDTPGDEDADGLADCADPDCDCDTGAGTGSGTDNAPPDGLVVAIEPAAPVPGDALTCAVTTAATDPDGDAVTVSFAWLQDGVDAGIPSETVPAATTSEGQVWTCEATPSDGTEDGPSATDSVLVTCPDGDGDGARDAACGGTDCDDTDPAVHPGATETLDGVDQDCDGDTDEAVVLVATGHACTDQSIPADDGPVIEAWVEALGWGADIVAEPATGLDPTTAPLNQYELVVYAKCGWAWQSYNQGTVDHLSTAHANGVSTLVVDDDGAYFSTTQITGATDLVLLDEPTANGSTSGTDWVVSTGVSHPALSGPAGAVTDFTYCRDSDDTTLLATGATVLMERADTGGPVWVLQSLSTGARTGIVLANVARTNEGAIPTDCQASLEVVVKNSVDWLLK